MPRTILITGCSKGFGKLFALTLARAGYQIAATSRDLSRMQELVEIAQKENLPIKTYQLDVTNFESINPAVTKIQQELGRVDVLINNAGYGLYSLIESVTPQEIEEQFRTNVFGLVAVTQAVIPIMKQQKSGHIINISSAAAGGVFPAMGLYSASKWAVEAISEGLHFELKGQNIKISIVQPGPYHTEFGQSAVYNTKATDSAFEERKTKLQAPFKGQPQEVADLVLKIVKSKKPKLRYPAGFGARLVFFLRKVLPERWFIKLQERVLGM